jgi:hypothetical protein
MWRYNKSGSQLQSRRRAILEMAKISLMRAALPKGDRAQGLSFPPLLVFQTENNTNGWKITFRIETLKWKIAWQWQIKVTYGECVNMETGKARIAGRIFYC